MSELKQTTALSVAEQVEQMLSMIPQEMIGALRQIWYDAFAELTDNNVLKRAKRSGDSAPDFTLPNGFGNKINLYHLLKQNPIVLVFYRGDWCPVCNIFLNALQQRLTEIESLGAKLVAISPQTAKNTADVVQKHKLDFEVLSDVHNLVATEYGLTFTIPQNLKGLYEQSGIDLRFWNGDEGNHLPVPATYVIDRDCTIKSAHLDVNYFNRMEIDDIITSLRNL